VIADLIHESVHEYCHAVENSVIGVPRLEVFGHTRSKNYRSNPKLNMTIIMLRAYFRNEPLHYNCNMQRFDRHRAGEVWNGHAMHL
jgi:hypothetical protein